ncbi:MAG: prepilin-type N-terminal cleavage/methylation domain-containing protein [candidate division Zixibacteria bacterium]|nr:prepilin-type N-terminal cleavage/methylation domain-containing protein [candidate division Zixibacteria bacterium]
MKQKRLLRNEKGFTLVEIAIVLIIIGLILGATVKGGDLIQSAKQKKFYNKFVKQWELTVLNYYDRTGGVLGDGTANGGVNAAANGAFDNINTAAEWTAVENRLEAVGLDLPTSNTANSYQFTFKGKESGTRTVNLNLYYLNATSGGGGSGGGNVASNTLYMTGMPTDLAYAVDRFVDDIADGRDGSFRQYTDASDWPSVVATATVNTQYILDVP